jgi:hypothetical protein
MGANHPATRPQSSAPALSLTLSEPAPLSLPLCLSLPLFPFRFSALSFSFTHSSTSSPSSKSCTMRSRIDYRLLFLLLFRSLYRCHFLFVSVACVSSSSSLSVARPCCLLFVLGGRLISFSSSFDSTCSYNSRATTQCKPTCNCSRSPARWTRLLVHVASFQGGWCHSCV